MRPKDRRWQGSNDEAALVDVDLMKRLKLSIGPRFKVVEHEFVDNAMYEEDANLSQASPDVEGPNSEQERHLWLSGAILNILTMLQ